MALLDNAQDMEEATTSMTVLPLPGPIQRDASFLPVFYSYASTHEFVRLVNPAHTVDGLLHVASKA
ncbi:hypothetical protein GCM10027347_56280 [Larkinella harenae]